jgi:hypothetical protein
LKGEVTHSCIANACRVGGQCKGSIGRVAIGGGIAQKRSSARGRVLRTSGIAQERVSTNSSIIVRDSVVKQRTITNSRIARASRVEPQRERSIGGVIDRSRIAQKCPSASSRVFVRGITKECPRTDSRAETAVGDA